MEAEAEAGELEVDLELGLELELGGGGEPSCLRAASKLKFIATEPLEVLAWARAPPRAWIGKILGPEPSQAEPGQAGPGQGRAMLKNGVAAFLFIFGQANWSRMWVAFITGSRSRPGLLLDKKCDVGPLEAADDDRAQGIRRSRFGYRGIGNLGSRIANRESHIALIVSQSRFQFSSLKLSHLPSEDEANCRANARTTSTDSDSGWTWTWTWTRSFGTCLPPSEIYGLDKREKLQMLMQRQPLLGASRVRVHVPHSAPGRGWFKQLIIPQFKLNYGNIYWMYLISSTSFERV